MRIRRRTLLILIATLAVTLIVINDIMTRRGWVTVVVAVLAMIVEPIGLSWQAQHMAVRENHPARVRRFAAACSVGREILLGGLLLALFLLLLLGHGRG